MLELAHTDLKSRKLYVSLSHFELSDFTLAIWNWSWCHVGVFPPEKSMFTTIWSFVFLFWVFFFLIQFSRTPLVLTHKKFVAWGGLQQSEFNIWTTLRKKDSVCSIWSQRVMWGAAGKHFRKIVFNVGKSLGWKCPLGWVPTWKVVGVEWLFTRTFKFSK